MCMIRKVGSRVVHRGDIPYDYYRPCVSPSSCNQFGWRDAWVRVTKLRHSDRHCAKCFPETAKKENETMKPNHLKSYLFTAVALYAVLVVALICHGAEPLPVALAAKAPPEAGPIAVTGSGSTLILPASPALGSLTCTDSACLCLVKSATGAPPTFDDLALQYKAATAAAAKTTTDLSGARAALTLATTADRAAQDAKEAARLALADFIGPPAPKPPEPPPGSHTVEFVAVGGTACKACRAIDKAIAEAKAAGVAIRTVNVDEDLTAVGTWKPLQLPTIVLLIDGAEINRYPRTAEEVKSYTAWTTAELTAWNTKALEYAKTLPAKKD